MKEVVDEMSHRDFPFNHCKYQLETLSEGFQLYVMEDGGSLWTGSGGPRWARQEFGAKRSLALGTHKFSMIRSVRWEFRKYFFAKQALTRAKAVPPDLAIHYWDLSDMFSGSLEGRTSLYTNSFH